MSEPAATDSLEVRLHESAVGTLARSEGGLTFAYRPDWLATRGAVALSCSLPLRVGAFPELACRSFFANLLPDGDQRAGLARALGRSESNDFGLLEEVGGDCGGAVSLWPPEMRAEPATHPGADVLDESRLADTFEQMDARPMLAGSGIRMSLAGAQPKIPVIRRGETYSLPGAGRASTHILKPEPKRFPGLAAIEHCAMQLAHAVGLEVPPTRLLHAGRPCLEIERYDRVAVADGHARIHQEDFCQALSVMPDRKYEVEGGPGFAASVALVRSHSVRPAADVLRLIQWLAFNVLIGNCDAHAKNLSLILEPAPRLAPFYDLVPTVAFAGLDRRLAMHVGGERLWDRIGAPQWRRLATQIQVAEKRVVGEVIALTESIPPALDSAGFPANDLGRLADAIRKRCAHVKDRAGRG